MFFWLILIIDYTVLQKRCFWMGYWLVSGFLRETHFRKNVSFGKDEAGKAIWKDVCVYARRNDNT